MVYRLPISTNRLPVYAVRPKRSVVRCLKLAGICWQYSFGVLSVQHRCVFCCSVCSVAQTHSTVSKCEPLVMLFK